MMTSREPEASEWIERQSGVYSRARRQSEAPETWARGVAERVQQIAPAPPVGVILHACSPFAGSSSILPGIGNDSPCPIRDLNLWLRTVEGAPRVVPVPTRLRMWLPVRLMIAIPIDSPVFRAGVMFVPCDQISRATIAALESLATEVALELEELSRDETLKQLRRLAANY